MINNNLKYYREKCGLTQYQLSQLSKTTKGTISNIENFRHIPNQELIKNISKSLGIKPCLVFDLGCYCCEFTCKK